MIIVFITFFISAIIPFLHVPKGSGMIYVREVAPSYNMLAVSGAINQIFYLNGQGYVML